MNALLPPDRSALFRVLAGAVMISFSGVWVKLAHVGPSVSAFYRVLFGGLIFLLIVWYRRFSLWHSGLYFLITFFAAFFFALDLFAWHRSIRFVGPGLATMLANFQVFFLSAAGMLFYRETLGIGRIFGIALAMLGLFLIVGNDWGTLGPDYQAGVFLGLATAAFYTGYILCLKALQSFAFPLRAETNLMFVSLICAALLGIEAAFSGASFAIGDTGSLLSLLGLGVFSQVLGWGFITRGLSGVKASLAGLLLLLQPSLAFVWDVLIFQKVLTWQGLLGALLSLSGIYLGSLPPREKG